MIANLKNIMESVASGKSATDALSLQEGQDLYCPYCREKLGKMSEVELRYPGTEGDEIKVTCTNCGKTFKHEKQYESCVAKKKNRTLEESKRPEEVMTDMTNALSRFMALYATAKKKGDDELMADLQEMAEDACDDLKKVAAERED